MGTFETINEYQKYYKEKNEDFLKHFDLQNNLKHFVENSNYDYEKAVKTMAVYDFINNNIFKGEK